MADRIRYFTGKPCKRGHIAERYVSTRQCVECQRLHKVTNRPKYVEASRAFASTYYWTNRAKVRAKRNAYDAANPEKKRGFFKAWYDRNKEARRISKAADRKANPEVYATRYKRWATANPEHVLANVRRRAARKKSTEGHHTGAQIKVLLKQQRGKCAYCRNALKMGYHADHIIPLSRGGTNWITNIQLTCSDCNHRKWAKDPLVWARETGRLI